jgi:hypothetical protein
MDSRDARWLGISVLVFVGSRLAWLAWNPAAAAHWEEAHRWMVAHEVLSGLRQPLLSHQADHYQGGTLAMSLLIVPFFALLGESLVQLKLAALLTSTAALCALYGLARVGSGRPAAVLAAVGYVAGPPLVAYWGLVPFGSHGESIVFTLPSFTLLLGVLSAPLRTRRACFGFGVLAGLGVWFCYTSAIGLLACALTWLLLAGLPRPRELLAMGSGAALGLAPWLVYNLRYEFAGLGRVLHLFGAGDPIDVWESRDLGEKLAALLLRDLPIGLLLPVEGTLASPWAPLLEAAFALPLYLGVGLGAIRAAGALRRPRRRQASQPARGRLELLLVLFVGIFALTYGISDFVPWAEDGPHAYRLFPPLAVATLLLGSTSAVAAWERGGWRRAAAVAGGASALIASTLGTLLLASLPPNPRQEVSLSRGYFVQGVLLHRKFEGDLSRSLEWMRGLSEENADAVLLGIGVGLEYRFAKDGSVEAMRSRLEALGPRERARVLLGIWSGLRLELDGIRERRRRGAETHRDRVFAPNLETLEALARAKAAGIPRHAWPRGSPGLPPGPTS